MLTATQKIELSHAHADYMSAECGKWDLEASNRALAKFTQIYTDLGLSHREAELLSWEVNQNYDEVLLAAIGEGYTNAYITTELIQQMGR